MVGLVERENVGTRPQEAQRARFPGILQGGG